MLEINRLLQSFVNTKKVNKKVIDDTDLSAKKPSFKVIEKITKALNQPGTNNQITMITGLSYSIVSVAVRFMRHHGDIVTDGSVHTSTGSNNLLDELKVNHVRSNTGVTGVSFNKRTNVFSCSYGRGVFLTFNNLLDAVCKRKSLELSKC